MTNEPADISEILHSYRKYLHANVSKVQILGDADERELKDVFVELSVVDQRLPQYNREFLGMWDSALRKRFSPFADADEDDSSPEMFRQEERKTKRLVKPGELLKPKTKAIVTGAPGSGKTTLLKFLALEAQEKENRLTIWLELKAIDKPLFAQAEKLAAKNGTLILQELWLKHIKTQMFLTDAETKILREHWREKFRASQVVVLLDGFDEVQDEAIETSLNRCVNQFATALHSNTLLISTRPYAQNKLGSQNLQELEIEPLNQKQIEAFLNCYYPNDAATKSLLKNLRERTSLRELIHVPLLLGVVLQLQREDKFTDDRPTLYETIVGKLVEDLDRAKSIRRKFKIDDKRLRLDFVKFLAFERLLRDQLNEEEPESSRLVFSFDLMEEKARAVLSQKRLPHNPRDLAQDAVATPLLREVGKDDYAFTHLTLQEYLAAQAFAAFYQKKVNEFVGLKIFCRAYHNPTVVEMEVLPMALALLNNADKFYDEIERLPESLFFTNFRVQLRGLVYGAKISDERRDKIIDRVHDFMAKRNPEESNYSTLIVRGLIGIRGQLVGAVIDRIALLLEDKDSDVRDCAAMALGQIGNEKAAEPLIKALSSEDWHLRERAAWALGQTGSEKAVDSLIKAFSDGDPYVQARAVEAFSKIRTEKAAEALINTLSSEDNEVQHRAVRALGEIGNDKAVEALINALNSEHASMRKHASWALERAGNEQAVDGLIKALSSEDRDVRYHAADALAKKENEKAVEALNEALSDEDFFVRLRAAEVLGKIGNEKALELAVKASRDKNRYVRRRAASALEDIGNDKAVEALIQALSDEDCEVQERVAEALGKIGSEKAVKPLISTLSSENWIVRLRIAEALGKTGNGKAVEALIGVLSDENSDVRRNAAEALGKIGNEEAVGALIKTLNDADRDVQLDAAWALAKIGNEKAVEALTKALSGEDSNLRGSVASKFFLEEAKDGFEALILAWSNQKAIEAVITDLSDEDSYVRMCAAAVLGRIGNEKAVNALTQASSDEDSLSGWFATDALGEIGNEEAVEALIKSSRDGDRLRSHVAWALGSIKVDILSKGLTQSLTNKDNFTRRKAAEAVGYYSLEPSLLEQLSNMASTDADSEVRAASAEAKEKFALKMELLGYSITKGTGQPLSDSASKEDVLVGEVMTIVASAGHFFREVLKHDEGIDAEIEFRGDDGRGTGQRVYLQLKSGDSYLKLQKSGKEIFKIPKPRHASYWISQAYPVLLVIRNSDGRIRWMNVTEYLNRHGTAVKQIEFQGETFTAKAVKQMRDSFYHLIDPRIRTPSG